MRDQRQNDVAVAKDAIFIDARNGGGNGNVVQTNTIGLAPRRDLAGTNYGAGVRINGVHNVIGSSGAGRPGQPAADELEAAAMASPYLHVPAPVHAGCAVDIHMAGDSYAGLRFVTAALNGPDKLCLSNWVPTGDRFVDIDDSLIWAVSGNGASPISQHYDNYSGAGGTMTVNIVSSGYTTFDNFFGFATVNDTGQIFNYPNFVNPAASDFHLATGSSAIDEGASQFPNGSVPPSDIEGNPRPTGSTRRFPACSSRSGRRTARPTSRRRCRACCTAIRAPTSWTCTSPSTAA
ncbi:MAG TPA: hypothetical protein VLB69_01185 [Rudaea sp.]|nr:hypothetical protein [Rudaea sp.]